MRRGCLYVLDMGDHSGVNMGITVGQFDFYWVWVDIVSERMALCWSLHGSIENTFNWCGMIIK